MINIADLENRWVKYKIKSYIPHAIIVTSLIVISILVVLMLPDSKTEKKQPQQQKELEKEIEKKVEKIQPKKHETPKVQEVAKVDETKKIEKTPQPIKKQIQQPTKQEEKKLLLKPSLNFMRDMQNATLPYYAGEEKVVKPIHHQAAPKVKPQPKKVQPVPKLIQPIKKVQKQSIIITRQDTQSDIEDVIKRFKTNNNPALSLFIAKKYYEIGKYNKSYDYALITNEINSNIEASWLIFAKSLVKLDEKEMAIKTLKAYVEHSSSNKAKRLLDEIQSGKFK